MVLGFGGNGKSRPNKKDDEPHKISSLVPEVANPSGGIGKGLYFDPSGLERAAKAVKELDSSRNAQLAYELTKKTEDTKQLELQRDLRDRDLQFANAESQRQERDFKYQQQLKSQDHQNRLEQNKQQDQLARQREQDILGAKKRAHEEELRRAEESVRRQEELRKRTIEDQERMRRDTEVAKVKAETEGKIRQERENHRLHIEQARVQAEENRKTVLEAISLATTSLGSGLMMLLGDKDRLMSAAATLSLVALGIYTAKVGTGVAGRFVEARLGKPSLVRETSRKTFKQFFTHPIKSVKDWTRRADTEHVLNGVIFKHDLEYRLQNLARATANTKLNQAPFRHMLFHGPPGTGKTLFSKRLAFNSGMDYAIMTGGDIAPLGKDAVSEIHKLFDWAETSRKGVLLFIDEADAFLQKRTANQLTPDVRNALNALLYRTGEASNNFMLVLSTNQPSQFDSAINDRLDEIIEFGLPHEEERLKMIKLYFNKYINYTTPSGKKINFVNVTDQTFEEFAKLTKGFSGREISKLAIAWQSTAFGTPDLSLTPELMHMTLKSHLESHKLKDLWNTDE